MCRYLLIYLLLLGCPIAWATNIECEPDSPGCVEVGKWQINIALGAGVRSNPVINREDIPLVVLPEISYSGERFFIQNLDFGAVLWETDSQQVNAFITPSYDQVFFHRWNPSNFVLESPMLSVTGSPNIPPSFSANIKESPPPTVLGDEEDTPPPSLLNKASTVEALNETDNETSVLPVVANQQMADSPLPITYEYTTVDLANLHKRRMAALAGLEYSYTNENWNIQAQWVQDVSGIHDGTEVRLALARQFYWNKQMLALSVGATWQSDAVIDYYYGIRADEVTVEGGAYRGRAGVSQFVRMDWGYALSEQWSLRLNCSYRQLADEIAQSPLIMEKKVITAFIGGVYHF
jgi:outer membrane protein